MFGFEKPKSLRQRDLLVEKVLKGGQLPAYVSTPPNTGGFTAKEGYGYDPKKAKQLLDSYLKEKGMDELPPFELGLQHFGRTQKSCRGPCRQCGKSSWY